MAAVTVPIERVRNVAVLGGSGAGKTTLIEGLLYRAGAIARPGRVDEGSSHLDVDPEAVRRRTTVCLATAHCEWRGHRLTLLDTPGYLDFAGEVLAALHAADAAVIGVDAGAGVEVATEILFDYARDRHLPVLFFVNKLDRDEAALSACVEALRDAFGPVLPFTFPADPERGGEGVLDPIGRRLLRPTGEGEEAAPLPRDGMAGEEAWREALLEAAAESDDRLLEKYLEEGTLEEGELRRGLRAAVGQRRLYPVFCGSALSGLGLTPLLDAIVDLLPSPRDRQEEATGEEEASPAPAGEEAPFAAFVFKTLADPYVGKLSLFRVLSGVARPDSRVLNASRQATERLGSLFRLQGREQIPVAAVGPGEIAGVAKLQATATGDTLCDPNRPVRYNPFPLPPPVYPVAVVPRSEGDEERLSNGLARLAEEDPTFRIERNAETGETIVAGMGELHLEVLLERLRRKFGVEVEYGTPRVAYRETIRKMARAEGKYKKQTGGHGQYGHVFLRLEPLPRGEGFAFAEMIFGGAVPRSFIPAVEKGVRETMAGGVLAGFPICDVRVTLEDGSYHPVDSSELAFKIAASLAFKKAFAEADPILLEPVLEVEVTAPGSCVGDLVGDLTRKRGRILGLEPAGRWQRIRAHVPQAEMFRYAIDLRSLTQGRGSFTAQFAHYEEVPAPLAQALLEAARAMTG